MIPPLFIQWNAYSDVTRAWSSTGLKAHAMPITLSTYHSSTDLVTLWVCDLHDEIPAVCDAVNTYIDR